MMNIFILPIPHLKILAIFVESSSWTMKAGSCDFSVVMKVIFICYFLYKITLKSMNFSILDETFDKRLIV